MMSNSNARMDFRVDPAIKELATRASALVGSHSLTEFVIQAIREKSMKVIEECEVITISNRSFDAFVAACEAPPAPNERLLAAQRRRKQRIINGDIRHSDIEQEAT